jgi:3-hydroxyacyl-CoA dehydrogenase
MSTIHPGIGLHQDDGTAARPGDIEVVRIYGWPAWRGGPMYFADALGLGPVCARRDRYAERSGDASLRPAPLLRRLAAERRGFALLA